MIQSIDGTGNIIGPSLDISNLEDYWNQYFLFRDQAPDLHQLIKIELTHEIGQAELKSEPYIDSQQTISRVLTKLGPTGAFHRQFTEQFPELQPNQILGMQLYALMAAHPTTWIYHKMQHPGHQYSHATYFIGGNS